MPKKKQKTKQEAPELSGGRSSATPDVRASGSSPLLEARDEIGTFEGAYITALTSRNRVKMLFANKRIDYSLAESERFWCRFDILTDVDVLDHALESHALRRSELNALSLVYQEWLGVRGH